MAAGSLLWLRGYRVPARARQEAGQQSDPGTQLGRAHLTSALLCPPAEDSGLRLQSDSAVCPRRFQGRGHAHDHSVHAHPQMGPVKPAFLGQWWRRRHLGRHSATHLWNSNCLLGFYHVLEHAIPRQDIN